MNNIKKAQNYYKINVAAKREEANSQLESDSQLSKKYIVK